MSWTRFTRDSTGHAVAAAACVAMAACGGGDHAAGPAAASLGGTPMRALSVGQGVAAATQEAGRALIVKIYGLDEEDRDSISSRLRRSIALLDAAGLSFQLLDCGAYYLPGTLGPPGFPPSWQMFSVATTDLAKAKAAGFEEYDPSTQYTFALPQLCGSREAAMSGEYRVLQLARFAYPDLFPGLAVEDVWDGYTYASFSNGNYVGVKNGRVVVHNGKNWNFQDVGSVKDFIRGL